MVKDLKCKKCSRNIRIDYSKAQKNEFTIACPGCSQKYKLTKPAASISPAPVPAANEINSQTPSGLRKIPCPKCKTTLSLDLTKLSKYPAVVSCKKCTTKIRINDPAIKSNLTKNNLDQLKTGTPTVAFDKAKIDPKNNWAYKLYYYTRRIPYLSKVTLIVYLSYLAKSVAGTLSQVKVDKMDQQSFLKLRAEVNVMSSQVFNGVVNPILSKNGISPRLVSWATSWFVKKVSSRILLNIIKFNGIDQNLPYIKKFVADIRSENSAIFRFFTHDYFFIIYFLFLIIIHISFVDFRVKFWPSIFASIFWAGLPLLLAHYKGYLKTKSVLIGNLAFWLLLIILPRYPESSILHYARETFDSISFYYLYLFITICLAALISDFLQSKGKNIEIINKLKFLFKPIVLVLAIMIPFICLTLFSTITKHKVTHEELKTFTQKNTDYEGYWYFLNLDSTKVNRLHISSESDIASDESGDINLLLTVYFDRENTIKLNKYEAELKLKEDYSFEIKYPIVFENLFEIKSHKNNILNGVLSTSSGEKVAITAERDSDGFEEVIRKKQVSIERLTNQIDTKILTMTFEEYSEGDYPHLIFKDISSGEEYDFRFLNDNNLNGVSILLDDTDAAFGLKANPEYLKKTFVVEAKKKSVLDSDLEGNTINSKDWVITSIKLK